jgi:multidrug efflux system membrane fusion protein
MEAAHRSRWIFAALGLLAIAMVAWVVFHKKPAKAAKVQTVPVSVVKATTQDVPVSITALGAAQAWTSDTVLAQVSGKLLTVNFVEGAEVKKGQLLAQVDPTTYRAALTQAQGALKRDQALLADARLQLTRYQTLGSQDSIARQTVDTQAALVKQDEGTVLIDQGAVAAAQANLDWCRIVSPVTGRAGVRLVDPGNLVSASGSVSSQPTTAAATNSSSTTSSGSGGSGIVVVNQIQPIAVTFTVPEGDFQRLSKLSERFRKPLATEAASQETDAVLGSGELSIADNRIDPATGTVELKARFTNADEALWPGQFVNIHLTLETLHNATTVPVTAVNRGPNGMFVYVVGPNNKVLMRTVVLALTQGATAVIKSGVQAGETVVVDGQMTLKTGSTIRVVQPAQAGQPSS